MSGGWIIALAIVVVMVAVVGIVALARRRRYPKGGLPPRGDAGDANRDR